MTFLTPKGSGKRKLVSKEQKTDNCNIQKERDNEQGNRAARPCFRIFYSLIHCELIRPFLLYRASLYPATAHVLTTGKQAGTACLLVRYCKKAASPCQHGS